jgi:hypothetical protein
MNPPSPPISRVLSDSDIEHFLTFGFLQLTNCFDTAPGSLADRWVKESWGRNGLSADHPAAWPNAKIHMPVSEWVYARDFAPRAFAAMGELCGGVERMEQEVIWSNGFIANYGLGRDRDWAPPGREAGDWHKDGDFFTHFLDSPEQALLVIALFSDIHPRGGGTFIACDSVAPVARYLAAHPEGVSPSGFPGRELISECRDFRETTGRAGDVFLLHPFLLHTSSHNHRAEARLMINPPVRLREPMRFDRRADGSVYSTVELGVLRALGVDDYDFRPTGPRQMVIPPRVTMPAKLLEKGRRLFRRIAHRRR